MNTICLIELYILRTILRMAKWAIDCTLEWIDEESPIETTAVCKQGEIVGFKAPVAPQMPEKIKRSAFNPNARKCRRSGIPEWIAMLKATGEYR